MTRALVLAAVLAVCGPSAWAQDCIHWTGEGIELPCNQTVAIPWTASFSAWPVCENNGWVKPCYDPIGKVTLYSAEQSSNRSITFNGVTIVYPAGDTATIGADGNVTIGGK